MIKTQDFSRQDLVSKMVAELSQNTEVMKEFLALGSKFDTEFLTNVQKCEFVAKGEEITLDEEEEAVVEESESTTLYAGIAVGALLLGGLMFYKLKK